MPTPESYDVFLSYNRNDEEVVEQIARRLMNEFKLRPYLDKWDIIRGERWQDALARGLERSEVCAAFLGPSGIGPWMNEEVSAYINMSVQDKKLRMIPVLLPGANKDNLELPLFLKGLAWVDLSNGLENEYEFIALVAGIRGLSPGPRMSDELPPESFYVRKSIRNMMAVTLKKASLDVSSYLKSPDSTLLSLAKKCHLFYPHLTIEEIRHKLKDARALAFEEKYSTVLEEQDERFQQYEYWESEFKQLLLNLGFEEFTKVQAISVGIGNGREHPKFYNEFQSLIGVDISKQSLELAKKYFPNMRTVQVEAEHLVGIDSVSQDLYISLRTYQSTFFDMNESLFEVYRVLRPGGSCVISIPYVYYVNGEVKKGLIRPGSKDELDIDLPYVLADKVRRKLNRLDFDSVGLRTGFFEIYIYGQKG
jgi:SAM-dependent methyltransferase